MTTIKDPTMTPAMIRTKAWQKLRNGESINSKDLDMLINDVDVSLNLLFSHPDAGAFRRAVLHDQATLRSFKHFREFNEEYADDTA